MMKKYILLTLLSFSFAIGAADEPLDCENAISTFDTNKCAAIELEAADAKLSQYLQASFKHNAYDPELIIAIKAAQTNWKAYMSSHCDSIYTQWREGSIRGVMAISCKTALTKQRTHDIWSNFLTYMDSTPPVLPEPK